MNNEPSEKNQHLGRHMSVNHYHQKSDRVEGPVLSVRSKENATVSKNAKAGVTKCNSIQKPLFSMISR